MSFFSDRFHAKPHLPTGQVRLAVREAEHRIREYWLLPDDVEEVIDTPADGEWHGEGVIQIKLRGNSGQVALHEDDDTRTILRAPESTIRSLQAHLRAALLVLDGAPVTRSRGLSQVVQAAVAEGFHTIRTELQDVIREEIRAAVGGIRIPEPVIVEKTVEKTLEKTIIKEPAAVASDVSAPTFQPEETPMFIPSDLGRGDVDGQVDVKSSESEAGSVAEAAQALRALRKGKTPAPKKKPPAKKTTARKKAAPKKRTTTKKPSTRGKKK
jgi:hypothetical protein